ncbi:MAG: ATP-binding protein, partial [Burkholderiales bacterium]|nr:ATP-binding protein [Burkholderiales bacterium]
EGTVAVLAPEIERKRVAVDARLPETLPPVYADADRLTEILLNLLENALRHTPEGGRVAVEASRDGAFVRVTVADSGPGIRPEDRERVFDRFYRRDPSAGDGSGLGLAIVRQVAERHGAGVALGSSPQGGLRVTLRFAPR